MAIVALIMRPWIMLMRTFTEVQCFILADDVLIIATGVHMAATFVKALNATHLYLQTMGAMVAPNKSYNFASHSQVKKWIGETRWQNIEGTIEVVSDLRYLGAHLTTKANVNSATLDDRIDKAMMQLKKLRYCPAGTQAKIRVINGKVYAGAFYGVEAAKIVPAKLARLSAAIIDAFRVKNDNHNADRFFTTLTKAKDELDPVVQVLSRRVMQIRRTSCKQKGATDNFKATLLKYATKHKQGKRWPKWFFHLEDGQAVGDFVYPCPQPHPSTKEHDQNWDKELDAMGPIGLLIEAVLWHGMAIDKDLKIWQSNEPVIDILTMPMQNLKTIIQLAAARARSRAEWFRNTSSLISKGTLEIDRDISQPSKILNDIEKGIVATSLMGGNQARCEISKYNEDVDNTCSYCREAESTADHIKWVCKEFKEVRTSIDAELARVPPDFLNYNVRCGIAPAMKADGKTTFWGKQLPEDTDDKIKKLLGVNMELHTPGKDQQSTDDRNLALEILAEPGHKWLNARQILLKIKQAHGSGVDLIFPTQAQIQEAMEGHGEDVQVRIYGDGSVTSPTKWWAALGGYGVWMPAWNENNQSDPKREEASYHGQAIGQTLTSTRLELMAWVRVLAMPIRSCYATDSASMMGKAMKLIKAVEEREKQIEQGKKG